MLGYSHLKFNGADFKDQRFPSNDVNSPFPGIKLVGNMIKVIFKNGQYELLHQIAKLR